MANGSKSFLWSKYAWLDKSLFINFKADKILYYQKIATNFIIIAPDGGVEKAYLCQSLSSLRSFFQYLFLTTTADGMISPDDDLLAQENDGDESLRFCRRHARKVCKFVISQNISWLWFYWRYFNVWYGKQKQELLI